MFAGKARSYRIHAGAATMTYCLSIRVNKGLIFASDSRTNAGVDYVTTYSKMHRFVWPGERVCILLTAGNLATSQAVINQISKDLEREGCERNLRKVPHLYDAAHYIGALSQAEQKQHSGAMERTKINTEASFILGGQIADRAPEIYLIYPQGNYISASPETPFLQIGDFFFFFFSWTASSAPIPPWKTRLAAPWCPSIPPFAATSPWARRWSWPSTRPTAWRNPGT